MVNALPQAVKQLQGTHRPSRDAENSLPASNLAPIQAPFIIAHSDRAQEVYFQLIQHCSNMKIISMEDDFILGTLALRIHEIEECNEELAEHGGSTYKTTNKEGDAMYRTHPASTRRSEALRHAQSLLVECGLTPVARAKVSANKEQPDNPFGVFK